MHVAALLSSALLAAVVSAAVVAPRQGADPHRSDFRTYGAAGCGKANYGVATLTLSQTNRCYAFPDPANYPVHSVLANNADSDCRRKYTALPYLPPRPFSGAVLTLTGPK